MSLFALLAAAAVAGQGAAASSAVEPPYGMIGKMIAKPGKREALMALLVTGSAAMPGNLTYVVGSDGADANAIWVSETWVNKTAHDTSLTLPQVKDAIAKARPLIADFSDSHVFVPVLPPKL